MANRLFVETNLDTRLVVLLHSEDTVYHFKESFCRDHKEAFPEIGDIQISSLKVEGRNQLYCVPDSIVLSRLFEGIDGNWLIYVDAVKVESGDTLTIQADAPSEVMDDTDSNSPFQPTLPGFTSEEVSRRLGTAQNFGSQDSFSGVLQIPSNSSGFPQQNVGSQEAALIGPDKTQAADFVSTMLASVQESKMLDQIGISRDGNRTPEDEAVKDNVTVDAESVKPTKEKKFKKAKTTSEVASGADIVEPVKVAEICGGKLDLAESKVDDSAAERKTEEQEKDIKEKVDQYASGEEGVDKIEDETKKRKRTSEKMNESCEDDKTGGDIDVKKDDVSEEEPEVDGPKLEACLSSSVLIHDNLVQGVTSAETGGLSRCSCKGQGTRKLLVFDLNGILADVFRGESPDGRLSSRSVFFRPFLASFLDFCFERFDVGIWSSRTAKLKHMINLVMGYQAKDLLFSFGQDMCITTEFKTLDNTAKPLFLKDLRRVWNHLGTCSVCGKGKYDETNTLLVDDSPEKALCNPPHTGIFPYPYKQTDQADSTLGRDGELRKYLERLVDAENVQKFVAENPIGQAAITETHELWDFYSKVFEKHK